MRVYKSIILRYNNRMAKRQKEGRRLKLDPYSAIIPYIMVTRNDAQNHIETSFETANAEAMIRELRHEGYDSIGMLHIILAAYVRTVSQRPAVNRFIRGQKIYARNGISVNLAVKKKMSLDSPDTTIKMHFKPTDTIFDVYRVVNEALAPVYQADTNVDKTAALINYIPGLIKKGVIALLKCLDYFGLLPRALTEVSPFHGSFVITSMGSLGINAIYHHLYDFGNIPVFISYGKIFSQDVTLLDGTVEHHHFVTLRIVTDERICDGYYYASAFKKLKRYMLNPDLLDTPVTHVTEDVD